MTINLTDPANHPANSPLTGERIECVIEALQRSIQYQNGGDMAYVIADAIKGLEELLVEKEAASKPVGNDELDQMIWKLERDGMTPKLLSLMRELREVRKAKGEPVAYIFKHPAGKLFWALTDESNKSQSDVIPVYATPPSVAIPPQIEPDYEVIKGILPTANPDEYACCIAADMWNACRAAMLHGDKS